MASIYAHRNSFREPHTIYTNSILNEMNRIPCTKVKTLSILLFYKCSKCIGQRHIQWKMHKNQNISWKTFRSTISAINKDLHNYKMHTKEQVKSNMRSMFIERYWFVQQHIVLDRNISQLGVESFFQNVIYYHWSGNIIGFNSGICHITFASTNFAVKQHWWTF